MAGRPAVLGMALATLLMATPAPAQAAPSCHFQLGFATLQHLLPAPIGQCLDNAHYSATGDAVQHSSGGLLVWRKSDNWTAFTNGYATWVNGPNGVQRRRNDQRFSWEANPTGLPIAGGTAAATAGARAGKPVVPTAVRTVPAASVSTAGLTVLENPALASVGGAAAVLAWVRNDAASPLDAQLVGTLTDATGAVLGEAKGTLTDLQPGQTKLAELTSVTKSDAVAGLRFQFTAVAAGKTTPTFLQIDNVRVDPADPDYVLIGLTNSDSTAHSGFLSVAITAAGGAVAGIAFGPYDQLNPGLSMTVRCISLLGPIPPGTQLKAQVDTAL